MTKTIGIDLGGTHIKAVLLNEKGDVLKQLQRATNDTKDGDWKQEIQLVLQAMKVAAHEDRVTVGLSAPGLANPQNNRIVLMPGRLQGLENFEWSDFLKCSTWVLNDAHAALVAEAKLGAGKGYKDIILLTLGTGIGGAVYLDGKLHQGLLNRAGHLGHVTLNADSDAADITGMPASLEDAIGNASIQQRSSGKYHSTSALVQDYQKGNTFATYVWLHSIKRLSVALSSFINILSPQVIILGGGIAEAGDQLFAPLKEFMKLYEWQHSDTYTPIVPAVFDEFSGAVGAAVFAQQKNTSI